MKKLNILFLSIFLSFQLQAQVPTSAQLIKLHNVANYTALNAIVNPLSGSLAFVNDERLLYQFNGNFWLPFESWNKTGNSINNTNSVGTFNAMDFKIKTNNADRIVIKNNGRVGVNTVNPNSILNINTHVIEASSDAEQSGSYFASHVLNSSTGPDKAFDNNTCTKWAGTGTPTLTSPQWIKIDYGAGQEKTITNYRVKTGFSANGVSYGPGVWSLQGSNDDSEWTTIHEQINSSYNDLSLSCSNQTAFRYYRLLMQSKADPSRPQVEIQELYLYEGQLSASTYHPAFVMADNGKIGLGTNTPTEDLHVIGNIFAHGSIVPDYVFETYFDGESQLNKNYKMLSLKETEDFVKKHKHLPRVPSAKEVEEQGGIIINEATLTNLEKIEELFLHIIEMNEEIKSLESELLRLTTEE
ncbi:MAG: discoidin domain-containing protein [Flavobacteriales bacterium]|nr:discoidin domain-containing protein [Flavobacteriales bacterium]